MKNEQFRQTKDTCQLMERRPATCFEEAYPIGNGSQGAMIYGGIETERISFIYNFYVLCGPSADPAGVKASASVKDAFAAIAEGKYSFISRGDNSGPHTK